MGVKVQQDTCYKFGRQIRGDVHFCQNKFFSYFFFHRKSCNDYIYTYNDYIYLVQLLLLIYNKYLFYSFLLI